MYSISYHFEVVEDLSSIDKTSKKRIKTAIESKLINNPILFGKPLQHSLKGLRSFKVGDYRIIFILNKTEIFIVLIAHRSIVYQKTTKRVSKKQ